MKSRRKTRRTAGIDYWSSYSDMMAALLLMFILIMSLTLLQSLETYRDKLKEKEEQLQIQLQQQVRLEEQQKQLEEQQIKIDGLVGVKSKLIEELSEEFEKTNLKIVVDPDTGAIAFDSSVLFDYNDHELKTTAKQFLNQFLPIYFKVILEGQYKEYISEIIIEGHTDKNGSYLYNLDLSQKRALSIAIYCFSEIGSLDDTLNMGELRRILTANGRSWSNIVLNEDGSANAEQSRRVEFKFRLKDDEMIEEMKRILEE